MSAQRLHFDRLCQRCAGNLVGQPVERSEHGLQIVRCPRCGAGEPAQPYPHLGPWPARGRFWLALLHAIACFVLLVGSGAAIISISGAMTAEGTDRCERAMRTVYEQWRSDSQLGPVVGWPDPQLEVWWDTMNDGDRADLRLLVWRSMEWDELSIILVATGLALFSGWAFPVLMPHRRPWHLTIAATPLIALCALAWFVTWIFMHAMGGLDMGMLWGRMVVLPMLAIVGILNWGAAIAGLYSGRWAARSTLRLFLTPRRRRPFAWLWPAEQHRADVFREMASS